MTTIVIPTYNEKDNIEKLISSVLKQVDVKILVVDDNSPDGTGKLVKKISENNKNVDVLIRYDKKGLGSAIKDGLLKAEDTTVGVMDADGSHPAKVLPKMLISLEKNDIVIGSRKVKGGQTKGWPLHRKIVSFIATLMARPLTSVKDPVSGFFLLNKKIIEGIKLNEKSCKMCLEILVKGNVKSVKEVPMVFFNRERGESKILNLNEFLNYTKHVLSLYKYKIFRG